VLGDRIRGGGTVYEEAPVGGPSTHHGTNNVTPSRRPSDNALIYLQQGGCAAKCGVMFSDISDDKLLLSRLFTVVCSARLRHTWRISAHRSPILPVGSIYVRLAATSSSFHATVARSSAVGPSLLRVRWPGTHCLTVSETRLCQPALSDVI